MTKRLKFCFDFHPARRRGEWHRCRTLRSHDQAKLAFLAEFPYHVRLARLTAWREIDHRYARRLGEIEPERRDRYWRHTSERLTDTWLAIDPALAAPHSPSDCQPFDIELHARRTGKARARQDVEQCTIGTATDILKYDTAGPQQCAPGKCCLNARDTEVCSKTKADQAAQRSPPPFYTAATGKQCFAMPDRTIGIGQWNQNARRNGHNQRKQIDRQAEAGKNHPLAVSEILSGSPG